MADATDGANSDDYDFEPDFFVNEEAQLKAVEDARLRDVLKKKREEGTVQSLYE